MSVGKEKFIFYLRLFLCFLITVYWAMWLLTLPKPAKKKINITATKKEPSPIAITETIKKEKTPEKIKPQVAKVIIAKFELPKLANLELKKPTEEKEQVNISINLNLPMTAGATREALLNKAKQLQISKGNSGLRGKVAIKKDSFKKESSYNDEFKESWLPKYLVEKDELKNKLESITRNLDSIANQLELEGIIKNPHGQDAAIIRNTETNDVEILKKGEEYKGLKLLGITNNEVRLGNESINKVYTKKLINKGQQK